MKKKTKRALFLTFLGLLVTAGIVRAQYPQLWRKTASNIEKLPIASKILDKGGGRISNAENVLGESIGRINERLENENIPIERIVEKVVNDTEFVEKIQTEILTTISEKTQTIQDLPQEISGQVRDEVRKEVRKQLCEEWLPKEN